MTTPMNSIRTQELNLRMGELAVRAERGAFLRGGTRHRRLAFGRLRMPAGWPVVPGRSMPRATASAGR